MTLEMKRMPALQVTRTSVYVLLCVCCLSAITVSYLQSLYLSVTLSRCHETHVQIAPSLLDDRHHGNHHELITERKDESDENNGFYKSEEKNKIAFHQDEKDENNEFYKSEENNQIKLHQDDNKHLSKPSNDNSVHLDQGTLDLVKSINKHSGMISQSNESVVQNITRKEDMVTKTVDNIDQLPRPDVQAFKRQTCADKFHAVSKIESEFYMLRYFFFILGL